MKNVHKFAFTLSMLIALLSTTAWAQSSGIEFFHGSLAEAKAKAKAENKLIFIDAYTSWCGPCRVMAANVFTDPSVGEYYNSHFINLKVDMEKGEGPELGRRYSVMGYPTLLFVDGNGEVVSRTMGGKAASDFIALGQKVVKAN